MLRFLNYWKMSRMNVSKKSLDILKFIKGTFNIKCVVDFLDIIAVSTMHLYPETKKTILIWKSRIYYYF